MQSHLRFNGVNTYGESLVSDQLKSNIYSFLDWGLLNIGAFNNIRIPSTSGAYGGNPSRLRAVTDPNYINGQVWEGFRSNWVWESGIEYAVQPIQISGIFVNGTFYPRNAPSPSSYIIDYPRGRVVFDTAKSTSTIVTCEYSYRHVNVIIGETPWFKQIQYNSLRIDDSHFLSQASGEWEILSQNRVQLPAIIIESTANRDTLTNHGYQLGGGHIVNNGMIMHVLAETSFDRDQIVDILCNQDDSTILAYDKNDVVAANRMPLTWRGSIATSALCYPDLTNTFPWKKITFKDTRATGVASKSTLSRATIRTTCEIVMEDL